MSAHKKKGGGGHEGEHHVDERWAISYMDMVTVLMCLFIVLFAMSTVDAKKFEQLKNSLATGFGEEVSQKVDTAEGVVVPPELVDQEAEGFTDLQLAQQEANKLAEIEKMIKDAAAAAGVAQMIETEVNSKGLNVRLVGSEAFFMPNESYLTEAANLVLNAVGPALASIPNQIMIEGHANPVPNWLDQETNNDWDLGSARANRVTTYLVLHQGIDGTRIGSTSFGARHTIADPNGPEATKNRRVDIVVVSDAPEAVRALIPQAVQQAQSGQGLEESKTNAPAATTETKTSTTKETTTKTTEKSTSSSH